MRNPAAAIQAILQGGYPAVVRAQYEHPENRIADLEQLVLLAGRSEALEPFLADQMLAGDLKGVDTLAGDEPTETLVLSTIHQAKGLEWSRVYVPRLVEDSFPHARSMNEPGGVDEERRIFYVAVTRAMNELFLTYPLLLGRGPRGPNMIATPSRFLQEIPPEFWNRPRLNRNTAIQNRGRPPVCQRLSEQGAFTRGFRTQESEHGHRGVGNWSVPCTGG